LKTPWNPPLPDFSHDSYPFLGHLIKKIDYAGSADPGLLKDLPPNDGGCSPLKVVPHCI